MAQSVFAVHLGGGLYLDSTGSLLQGAPDKLPVYEAPFKIPVDPKKAKGAIEEVQKALSDINKNPDVLKKFAEFGFDTAILDVLSSIAKIASVIAPVLAVAAIAVDILKLFGMFKDGPSPLETLVKQRFDELESNVESIKALIQSKDLRTQRVAIENFTADIRTHFTQLNNVNPTDAQLENDRNRLLTLEDQKEDAVGTLLDQATWLANFDRDEHTRVWPWLQKVLRTYPPGATTPVPVVFPADGSLQFDHRLMVPLATWAAESYIAAIRGIVPEFRSTGEFNGNLRLFANKVDDLVSSMRTYALARTYYRKEDFAFPVTLDTYEVVATGSFPHLKMMVSARCSRWPVGAMDLRYHGDRFFGEFLDGHFRAEFFGYPHPTRCGGMNFRWTPPAVLEPAPFNQWQIANPEECAAAANAQADQDYADLLSVSGYTELVRIATLLRNQATEPDRSETVSVSKPALYRDPQPQQDVVITSDPIFMTGTISSAARREPQKCVVKALAGTQPIKRARPTTYRIVLRTLRAFHGKRWHESTYSQYHEPRYESDPSDPKFLRMAIFQSDAALDQHVLASGASPRTSVVEREATATLKAHTFDWWIPVKAPFSLAVPFDDTMTQLRAFGWTQPNQTANNQPGSMQTLEHHQPILAPSATWVGSFSDLVPELYWQSGQERWEGQHRDPREQNVSIKYKLRWQGDRLSVNIENDPDDRNYVVFLVLEEQLGLSGAWLHTAIPLPVNGQLTYVPQKFFDDEAGAIAKAASTISEFSRLYAESRTPGPIDPVVGWIRPGDLMNPDSIDRFVVAAREHAPAMLTQVTGEQSTITHEG